VPYRGGNWNNGSDAGVFYLNLNNPRTNSNSNLGFRAALSLLPDAYNLWVIFQCVRKKGLISLPIALLWAGKKLYCREGI